MITRAIKNCLENAKLKGWNETYWAFDIHGTMLKPTFKTGVVSTEFYPYAKEVMQILSRQKNIVRILYTCSHPDEIVQYLKYLEAYDIHFHYVNENPDVCAGAYGHYDRKFYFNVLFEDKAGFDPMTDWKDVLELLNHYNIT
ncbi:MAG TPA: hypothetical protein VD884_11270 [Ohtaekwangia sp.]|nr:hypothetical protein [Ohtaekwangia sp.]